MATRATYEFESEHACTRRTTLYIHWDGYPAGAALYLYKALSEDVRGGMPERMIRANDGAELTENHELHGDTEFRYTVLGAGPGAAQALALDRYVSVQRLGALRADALAAHDRAVDAAWSRYCRAVDAWMSEQGIGGPLEGEVER